MVGQTSENLADIIEKILEVAQVPQKQQAEALNKIAEVLKEHELASRESFEKARAHYDDKFTMMNTKVNECHAALLENTQDSLDIIRSEVQKTNTFLYRLFVTIGLSLAFLSTFIGLVEWQLSHIK
jgi:DNA-binding protein H-NS